MSKIKKLEHQAFQLITESGLKGVLQSEIWKTLESTSQEGSRITLKLEKKSLIKRKRELYNGRWTDRIFSKRRPVEINSIIDVPCAICDHILKCSEGSIETIINCNKMDIWLLSLVVIKINF